MPELPEVHTITNDLKKTLEGAKIQKITINSGYSANPNNENFLEIATGSTINQFKRVAKNIIMELDSDHFILVHLAMTGKLLIRKTSHPIDPHTRVKFHLEIDNKKAELRFCDMRMFGKVQLLNKEDFNELKHKYGPEPLSKDITPEEFLEIVKSKNTNIKNLLLDQSKVSGLGNVYATDALWMAKIHPETKTTTVTLPQATELLKASKEILLEGIKHRGISMSDYVDAFGRKGKQQEHFRIYQKEECPECASKTEFIKINGRGTYYCPICQPKDNQARLI